MKFRLTRNQKLNCQYNHIPLSLKGNRSLVLRVYNSTASNAHKRSGKTTAIRYIAIRETGVSRHIGSLIEGTPETPCTSQHYNNEGFKRGHNWSPIMPKDVSRLDSECEIFPSGLHCMGFCPKSDKLKLCAS